MYDKLAQELNSILEETIAYSLFSDLGKRIFFPKGIIAQGAEAKKYAHFTNATIGMAIQNGKSEILPAIQELAPNMSSAELVSYAPTAGLADLRKKWQEKLYIKNPNLCGKAISLPVVVPGLTAGLSYTCELFLQEGRTLIAANPSWDNYSLIAQSHCGGTLRLVDMFSDTGYNIEALRKALLEEAKCGVVRLILNFPQNPSGYSPTVKEAKEICQAIKDIASEGAKVLVICDDAYFGLDWEKDIERQSLFAYLCDIHENVLAIKIDGPTKEDFAWGFRVGFLTFGAKGLLPQHYDALVKKLMGVLRSSVSCSSTVAQSMLLRAFENKDLENQKKILRDTLEERYKIVKQYINTHTSEILTTMPFNSGYFMSFRLKKGVAEDLRQKLLHTHGIGTVAIDNKTLRVAFSSIDKDKINAVYDSIYEVAKTII